MSNLVSQIHAGILAQCSTTLGATYHKMRRPYAPDQEDLRSAKKCYGVIHNAAVNAEGVTRVYTLDHGFTILLMTTVVQTMDDDDIQVQINDLYDKADDLLSDLVSSKINLPAIVLVVNEPGLSEPEILANKAVLLRVSFNVKYRSSVV